MDTWLDVTFLLLFVLFLGNLIWRNIRLCLGLSVWGTPAGCLKSASPVNVCWICWVPGLIMFCYLSVPCYLFYYSGLPYTETYSLKISSMVILDHSLDLQDSLPLPSYSNLFFSILCVPYTSYLNSNFIQKTFPDKSNWINCGIPPLWYLLTFILPLRPCFYPKLVSNSLCSWE